MLSLFLFLSVQSLADEIDAQQAGAIGDGKTDDTEALQKVLNAAAASGGGTIRLGTGNYLCRGTLNVPPNVTIEGIFHSPTIRTQNRGSTLLSVHSPGNSDGEPFITLNENSTLKGITIFYPEQTETDPPIAYPWCIRGTGDNCSIVDVLLVNPYMAVDFGTFPAGRHYIRGLYGQPLYRGLFIDKCFDVGRIEDVHFWPFWTQHPAIKHFMETEATAFLFGRTDWEYVSNCFCIWYRIGFHFVALEHGPGNVILTTSGSDVGPTAVRVDACMKHAGVSFVNGQFMAGIEIGADNEGPVKFTACGFWNVKTTDSHIINEGTGHLTFIGCHFVGWAQQTPDAPCMHIKRGGLTVNGCDFMDIEKKQLLLEPEVEAALIYGNRFRGRQWIENRSQGAVQIALNAALIPPAEEAGAVVVDDLYPGFKIKGRWHSERSKAAYLERYRWIERLAAPDFVSWTARLPEAGTYDVFIWCGKFSEQSFDTEVTYVVEHANGESRHQIDQNKAGNGWHPLGSYEFRNEGIVKIASSSGDRIFADAVKWVPRKHH